MDYSVLILVVVDDGLVLVNLDVDVEETWCLNPCCSGQWSRTTMNTRSTTMSCASLNPYCSGRWSRTARQIADATNQTTKS